MPSWSLGRLFALGGGAVFSLLLVSQGCEGNTSQPVAAGVGGSASSSSASGANGGTGGLAECAGPTVPSEAYGAEPGPVLGMGGVGGVGGIGVGGGTGGGTGGAGGAPLAPTEIGAAAPVYQLDDVHPLSCGFKATYGLEAFKGKVTVAALWAGW